MASTFSVEELSKAISTLDEALEFAEVTKNNPTQFKIARDGFYSVDGGTHSKSQTS